MVKYKENEYYCDECGDVAFYTKNEDVSLVAEKIICTRCKDFKG